MKKYFKILVLILIISTSQIKGVKAESFYEDNWITGVYANLIDGDFSKPQLMRFIRRRSDNQASYCITPRVLLYEEEQYSNSTSNLTQEQMKRIEKLAYYGYGYGNHNSDEWYAITQFMIWKAVEPNMDIFFTDSFRGNRISRFDSEISELEQLVDNSETLPDMYAPDLLINDSYQIEDWNNVLNNYHVTALDGIETSIDNNILNIKSTVEGNYTIQLDKTYDLYSSNPLYYSASRGQSILVPGNLETLNYGLNINVLKSTVYLTKQNPMTGEVLPNALYGIYDENYNFIKSLTTDENGQAVFDNLMPGTYNFLELEAPPTYQIDPTYHDLVVDSLYKYLWLSNEKINAYVYLHKYITDNNIIQPEKNIEFEVYDSNDNYVTSFITDNTGLAIGNLIYGKYRIHQLNSTENYEKVNDFYIEINNREDKIYYLNDIKIEDKSQNIDDNNNPMNEELIEDNKIDDKKEEIKNDTTTDNKQEIDKSEEQEEIKQENIQNEEIKSNSIKNPQTIDNIYIYIILGYIAFIALLYIIASMQKQK